MLLFRLLCMCMIMSMVVCVVFIWYICHLVPPYQVRKKRILLHNGLRGQNNGWGTLLSHILSTLCNNRILIFIVINGFNTTRPTFRP